MKAIKIALCAVLALSLAGNVWLYTQTNSTEQSNAAAAEQLAGLQGQLTAEQERHGELQARLEQTNAQIIDLQNIADGMVNTNTETEVDGDSATEPGGSNSITPGSTTNEDGKTQEELDQEAEDWRGGVGSSIDGSDFNPEEEADNFNP